MEIGCWFGAITMNVISWYGPCLHWKIAECSKSSWENMEQCYKVIVSLTRNVRNNRKKLRMMWLGAERWIKNDEWTELCRNVCVSVFFLFLSSAKCWKCNILSSWNGYLCVCENAWLLQFPLSYSTEHIVKWLDFHSISRIFSLIVNVYTIH